MEVFDKIDSNLLCKGYSIRKTIVLSARTYPRIQAVAVKVIFRLFRGPMFLSQDTSRFKVNIHFLQMSLTKYLEFVVNA